MKVPVLGINVDERFQQHRLRSTSLAGIAGAVTAGCCFEYHLIRQHVIRWELVAVILIMVAVKFAAMAWYHFTD